MTTTHSFEPGSIAGATGVMNPPAPPARHPSPTAAGTQPAAPASVDSSRRRRGRYLPGLDGLRAVSVLAVMLYHAAPGWLPGGFLGVEVFFVISGYLITSLLLSEHASRGRISLRSFWFRRARRLLPALFLLLAAVAFLAATFYREEAAELRAQLVAALTYSTNWFQIAAGQSYFASVERPSPLQHLWSLAIEEQFYLVWPVLLVVVLGAARRTRRGLDRVRPAVPGWVLALIGAGAGASALLMAHLYRPALDPSRVYYGTDTRAQGLLLGALLAFVWQPPGRRAERVRRPAPVDDAIGLVGLLGLAWAFLRFAESDRFVFRGGLTLVSVLSVLAIIGVVNPSTLLARHALGNRLLAAVGRRSYALYLWHWPIYVFTRPGLDLPLSRGTALALRFALTFAAAEVSYRYVEVPIRNGALGRWLAALRSPSPARRAHRRRGVRTVAIASAMFLGPVTLSLAAANRPLSPVERAIRFGGASEPEAQAAPAPSPGTAPGTAPGTTVAPARPVVLAAATNPPLANRKVTVLADSVLRSGQNTITEGLSQAGWEVDYRARAAWMLYQADESLASEGVPVGATVVIGIGYNTLWERDRANFNRWTEMFDTQADELLATLTRLGAQRFVWVTLREPSHEVITPEGEDQYERYVWYFPYVNERLRALRDRHPNLALADWAAVSDIPDITYDAIHLNSAGARLMLDTIKAGLGP